eukprot:4622704-Pyramimonas_sp.AAC.1
MQLRRCQLKPWRWRTPEAAERTPAKVGRAERSDPRVGPDCQAERAKTTHSLGTWARLRAAEGVRVNAWRWPTTKESARDGLWYQGGVRLAHPEGSPVAVANV